VYSEIWSALATSDSSGEVLNRGGVLVASGGGKWPVMNTAFLTSPVKTETDLQDRILLAAKYYGAKKALWLFISFDEWLDPSIHAEEVFWKNGICHMQNCVGMQTRRLLEPTISAPELDFRLVENDADRLEFCDINADSYGFSAEWRDDVGRWISQWPKERVRLYIAYSGKEAVSSAMVYLMGDVAYLGFVATRQEHQRRGYAGAIARYAIAVANEEGPFSKTILHSTLAGLPLYRSLGYSEVTSFGVYLGGCE
jgi:GNAT superfamily N-acetyltransferase